MDILNLAYRYHSVLYVWGDDRVLRLDETKTSNGQNLVEMDFADGEDCLFAIFRFKSRTKTERQGRTKLEFAIAEQRIKHEQDTKNERIMKAGRDKEMDGVLASACVSKAKRAESNFISDA
ncbi:MAG: hypothetical protein Q9170_007531 [Blastenia crenularia]